MNSMTREKIYKYRRYPHIDPKVHWREVYRAVESPAYVVKHGFYPFIHYTQESTKFPKAYLSGAEDQRDTPKRREIMYSCHMDRYIYEYYSYLLNQEYNKRVKTDGIGKCAVAYRNNLHKSNIHIAKEAFDAIRRNGDAYILIGDFTGYFDNMAHVHLKNMLCSLLQVQRLPDDHYAVFKSITKYAYIDLDSIKAYRQMNRKQFYALDRLFSPEEFRSFKKNVIQKNVHDYGIPQGSAISAVYSNVYLLDFDKSMNDYITAQRGFYRRYCDDFIAVFPCVSLDQFVEQTKKIQGFVKETPNLILQPEKAKAFHYCSGHIENCSSSVFEGCKSGKNLINFLGFSFDGISISIRQKTISKFYRRMYKKADTITAHNGLSPNGKRIPMRNIYKLYSKYGKKEDNHPGVLSHKKQGNFLSYVDRAKKVFYSEEAITRDTRRAWEKLLKRLHPKHK